MIKILTPLIIGIALLSPVSWIVSPGTEESARYCNARYGFCVNYPSEFAMEPPPANDDGRRFSDRDGLVMTASGINNANEDTLQTEKRSQGEEFDKITYRAQGDNWFVLSGHKGDKILYLKTFVGRGSINHLYIEYPTRQQTKYSDVVAKVARSFKPGNLAVGH